MNAGEKEKALQTYLRRAELGQFYQEVSLSLYYAAQLKDLLGYPDTDVIGTFLKASSERTRNVASRCTERWTIAGSTRSRIKLI